MAQYSVKSSPTLVRWSKNGEQRTPGNLRSPYVEHSRAPTEEKSAAWRDQQRSGCRVLFAWPPTDTRKARAEGDLETFRESHEEREIPSSGGSRSSAYALAIPRVEQSTPGCNGKSRAGTLRFLCFLPAWDFSVCFFSLFTHVNEISFFLRSRHLASRSISLAYLLHQVSIFSLSPSHYIHSISR